MRGSWGGLLGLMMAMAVPGVADAQSTALPDVPVAACPAGASPAALRVSGGATGTWRLGPFDVRLTARGLRVAADGRTLWSSARGGFAAAGAGDPGIVGGRGGFYGVRSSFTDCWRRQSVLDASRRGRVLTLRGRLAGGHGSLAYTIALAPAGAQR